MTVFVRDSKVNRKKLKPFGNEIRVVFGDITDKEAVKIACGNQSIVIHLAAVIPPFSEENVTLGYAINEGGTQNIVEAMEEVNPNGFLFFSSSVAVYGDRLKNPMISITDPLHETHHDHYSIAKIRAEQIIKNSRLNWSIFRLTAIMGIGNHKISGIMFDVPLETPMEIATVKDTAHAFILAFDKHDQLNHQVFNLSGGPTCRLTYQEFLTRAFYAFGMGKPSFPPYAFARQNFHCGYFSDGDILNDILHFRRDTLDTYFDEFAKSVHPLQRLVTLPFGSIVKKYLVTLSEPYKAYRKKDAEKMKFYFGEIIDLVEKP